MVLSTKFNDKVSEAGDADSAASQQQFNPFAANVHLSGPNAVKLAALEEGAGIGIMNRVTTGDGARDAYGNRRDRKSREEEARARMLALAQAWDAEVVTVGGVRMTNAEAQAARRRILENPEYYADWAKQRGLINEGEEQQFIETARRMTEMKERERIGQLSPTQKEEMDRLQESRLGRAVDQATGHAHNRWKLGMDAAVDQRQGMGEAATAPAETDALFDRMSVQKSTRPPKASSVSSVDDPVFASAPSLRSGFAAGLKATEPLERVRTEAATNETPRQPDRAAASGLDL